MEHLADCKSALSSKCSKSWRPPKGDARLIPSTYRLAWTRLAGLDLDLLRFKVDTYQNRLTTGQPNSKGQRRVDGCRFIGNPPKGRPDRRWREGKRSLTPLTSEAVLPRDTSVGSAASQDTGFKFVQQKRQAQKGKGIQIMCSLRAKIRVQVNIHERA